MGERGARKRRAAALTSILRLQAAAAWRGRGSTGLVSAREVEGAGEGEPAREKGSARKGVRAGRGERAGGERAQGKPSSRGRRGARAGREERRAAARRMEYEIHGNQADLPMRVSVESSPLDTHVDSGSR